MTNKRPIGEHLRERELYMPVREVAISPNWKNQLLIRYARRKPLIIVSRDERTSWIMVAAVVLPMLGIAFAAASFFELIHPALLITSFFSQLSTAVPIFGLKEGLTIAAIVNLVTFLAKVRVLDRL